MPVVFFYYNATVKNSPILNETCQTHEQDVWHGLLHTPDSDNALHALYVAYQKNSTALLGSPRIEWV